MIMSMSDVAEVTHRSKLIPPCLAHGTIRYLKNDPKNGPRNERSSPSGDLCVTGHPFMMEQEDTKRPRSPEPTHRLTRSLSPN